MKKGGSFQNQILEPSVPAVVVMAEALGITHEDARRAFVALAKAGYTVAPMEPTNSMFTAYIESYGRMPSNPDTVITAVGKARSRWKAMAKMGMAIAMSTKRVEDATSY